MGRRRFEVVVCSMDRNKEGFQGSYPNHASWLAIDFGSGFRESVKAKYRPPGVPTLTIVNLEGNMVVHEGDRDIAEGASAFERWLRL